MKKVVITSTRDNFEKARAAAAENGFEPVSFPCIEIWHVPFTYPEKPDWVVFTSKNAVARVFAQEKRETIAGSKIAAIAGETAAFLKELSVEPDFVPPGGDSESFVREFPRAHEARGRTFYLPVSQRAGKVIEEGLSALSGKVIRQVVYETRLPENGAAAAEEFMRSGPFYYIIFSSPSAFENFLALTGDEGAKMLGTAGIAAMGRTTASAIESKGYGRVLVPDSPSFEGIMKKIKESEGK